MNIYYHLLSVVGEGIAENGPHDGTDWEMWPKIANPTCRSEEEEEEEEYEGEEEEEEYEEGEEEEEEYEGEEEEEESYEEDAEEDSRGKTAVPPASVVGWDTSK